MNAAVLIRQWIPFSRSVKWTMQFVALLALMLPLGASQTPADSTHPPAVAPVSDAEKPGTPDPQKSEQVSSADKPVVLPDKDGNTRRAEPAPTSEADLVEKWGIHVQSTRLTAAGNMIDFRYRVVNPEKALPLFDRKTHPVLTDEATGAKFGVPNPPKVGSLRSTRPPKADRNYFMLFANPGGYIKAGSSVTITAGEFKAEHLVVQ